jgi:hypothetical protein
MIEKDTQRNYSLYNQLGFYIQLIIQFSVLVLVLSTFMLHMVVDDPCFTSWWWTTPASCVDRCYGSCSLIVDRCSVQSWRHKRFPVRTVQTVLIHISTVRTKYFTDDVQTPDLIFRSEDGPKSYCK